MISLNMQSIYGAMPIWAQNAACSLAGIGMRSSRYNKCFFDFLDFLVGSQWWSLEKQQAYQDGQVCRVIAHAYNTVPYYRIIMDERHLKPSDIRSTADLPKLPILTKDLVRQHGAELISTALPAAKRVYGHTGGTTGKSLQLYADQSTQARQWAVWWRHRKRFGLDIDDEFIVFAGRNVIPLHRMDPPFWRRNLPMHQTYVSIHHMTQQNMPALVSYLQSRKVKYYSGYPSAVYLVAKYMLEHDLRLPHPPEVTVLGAETLLPHQKRAMQAAFGGRITDQYGASEQCGNISACEMDHYHVDMEFGHIEFLPVDGCAPTIRRIICTGFWNEVMPLIRYDIGDLATLPAQDINCPCGRHSPVVEKIDGRIESYIITPDGRQAGRLDFIFKDSQFIEEAQFVQDEINSVRIRIVKNPRYTTADEVTLRADLEKYLGKVIRFDIEYVDEIPREKNGKFRQIVSNVFKEKVK